MKTSTTKKLTVLALAGTVLATGFTAAVIADERSGARERAHQHERGSMGFRAGERFGRTDADGDRMISLEEFQAVTGDRFASMDADGDGLVSPAEMVAERTARAEERAAMRIERADANGDGFLSLEEATAASGERFARIDRNDSGTLEPRELRRSLRGHRDDRGDQSEVPAVQPEAGTQQ
ncbi:MAG: hypothetical protein AAF590_03415 [Pseudomonadota bacterium]